MEWIVSIGGRAKVLLKEKQHPNIAKGAWLKLHRPKMSILLKLHQSRRLVSCRYPKADE
jgi:hypothetical protein